MPRGKRCSAAVEPQSQLTGQTLHMSLELSQATWLVTALVPGGDKMSKHTTPGGDGVALIELVGAPACKNRSAFTARRWRDRNPGSWAGWLLGAPLIGSQRRATTRYRRTAVLDWRP
jgi:hypothetical protein